jgi:hypothetical protein
MKDRRLIEALDYIDDEYIASAALYKMCADAEKHAPIAKTAGESLKKHWKHYLGFVACLLVLALAAPLFGYLPEIINSFAAGWGEGSETLKGDETTNQDTDNYEESALLDNNRFEDYYPIQLSEQEKHNIEEAYYNTFTRGFRWFNESGDRLEEYLNMRYLGKFNEKIILCQYTASCVATKRNIAGYVFFVPKGTQLLLYDNGEFWDLNDAYVRGMVTKEDIGKCNSYLNKTSNITSTNK